MLVKWFRKGAVELPAVLARLAFLDLVKGLWNLFLGSPVLSFLVRVFVRLEETGSGS